MDMVRDGLVTDCRKFIYYFAPVRLVKISADFILKGNPTLFNKR